MIINHNVSALNAYRNLSITDKNMSRSLERLSSGLRINRAADDAAGLAISEKMRAQIRGLNQATANAQDGISLIQTAEGALNETHDILQRMRELSVQAANDTLTASDRQNIQDEIDQLVTEIDRIGNTTEFNTKKLLDGTTSALTTTDKLTTRVFMRDGLRVVDQFGQKADGGGNYELEIEAKVGVAEVQKTDIMRVKHGESTTNIDVGFNQAIVKVGSSGIATAAVGSRITFNFGFQDGVNHSVDLVIPTLGLSSAQTFNLAFADAVAADAILKERVSVQGVNTAAASGFLADVQSLTKGAAGNFTLEISINDDSAPTQTANGSILIKTTAAGTALQFSSTGTVSGSVDTEVAATGVTVGADTKQSGLENFAAIGLNQGTYKIITLSTGTATSRTQTSNAALTLVAQYRQSGTGNLVTNMGVYTGTTSLPSAVVSATGTSLQGLRNINAQLAFEVTAVDGDNITLKVTSYEMDLTGTRHSYEAEWVVDRNQSITATQASQSVGNITFNEFQLDSSSATISVGDSFIMNVTPDGNTGAADAQEAVVVTQTTEENGGSVSRSFSYYMDDDEWNNTTTTVDYLTLNTANGSIDHSEVQVTFSTLAAYTTNGGTMISFDRSAGVGELASYGTQLRDIEAFWDKSGNFLLEDPQSITIVQGDGQKATVTLFGTDTIQSVKDKLNSAIADQLGQSKLDGVGATHSDKFVSYVTNGNASDSGLEAVAGTFVIRSAITGDDGTLTFVGDENVIKALSLTDLTTAKENVFTVNVTDAHTGDYVAKNVSIEGNMLVGAIHPNVDVEFDNMTGIETSWNTLTKNFDLKGGFENKESTFVHIVDNTMVFQIGANPLQDVGAAIGDMRARALGVDNILVTDRENATASISKVDAAIQRVSSERSKMGALQNRLDHTINNLGVASENLTSAESRIRDLDFAKEMMSFTKSQIMLQAGTAMLAQANQKPQSVLQLLG